MSKFHINKHGVPAPCRATRGNCPLGGIDIHFDNIEYAQAYIDNQNEKQFGLLAEIKANQDSINLNQLINNLGENRVIEDLAYMVNADKLENINQELIEEYDLIIHDVHGEEAGEQFIEISDEIGADKALEELENRLDKDSLNNIISELNEEYDLTHSTDASKYISSALKNVDKEILNNSSNKYANPIEHIAQEDIQQIVNRVIEDGTGTLSKDSKRDEIFTSYGKLGTHRVQYYKNELNLSTKEIIDLFSKSIVEDHEDGEEFLNEHVDKYIKSNINEPLEKMKLMRSKYNDELILSNLINHVNDSQWGMSENKYFNKFDELLNVDSKEGFIAGDNTDNSRSVYLDKDGINEKDINRQKIMLKNRASFYKSTLNDKVNSDKTKKALDNLSKINTSRIRNIAK